MFDHVGFAVSNYKKSKSFYIQSLAPLGYGLVMEVSSERDGDKANAGFGTEGRPRFWISTGTPVKGPMHVAFKAKNRKDTPRILRFFNEPGRDGSASRRPVCFVPGPS